MRAVASMPANPKVPMSNIKRYMEERYGAYDNWPTDTEIMRVKYPTERPNFVIVYTPNCDLAFSYETLIGVQGFLVEDPSPVAYRFKQWLVAENEWGPTTGKHLNWLDNGHKEDRVPQEEVERVANRLITGRAQAELTDLTTAHDAAIKAINGDA